MEGRDGWMDLHIKATEYQDKKEKLFSCLTDFNNRLHALTCSPWYRLQVSIELSAFFCFILVPIPRICRTGYLPIVSMNGRCLTRWKSDKDETAEKSIVEVLKTWPDSYG
jgi:hypothetical protein